MRIARIFIIIIFLFPGSVFATSVAGCSEAGYTIATINGIFTNETDAGSNADALAYYVGKNYNGEPLNVKYLFNPSHLAGLGDLVVAAYQKYFDSETVKDYDLIEMLRDASEKVKTQKILLVAHSQGNFYANSFYDLVAGQVFGLPLESIGVYAVATPASRVAGGGKWLTSDTDMVIAGAVASLPFRSIMTPNTHIEVGFEDKSFGHDFVGVYMKNRGDVIVSDIEASLGVLKSNSIQDEAKPCLAPPELTTLHKAEGAVLAVADPVANATRIAIVDTAKLAYNSTAFIAQITLKSLAWTYEASIAMAKSIDKVFVLNSNLEQSGTAVTGSLSDSVKTDEQNQENVVPAIAVATRETRLPQRGSLVSLVATAPPTKTPPAPAPSLVQPPIPKNEPETRIVPKLLFLGPQSPGFGAGSPVQVSESQNKTEILTPVSHGRPLSAPEVSIPQCDFSLASDGCLLATTTVRISWDTIPEADYYEVTNNGEIATTTDATAEISLQDFRESTIGVSAFALIDGVASSSQATFQTLEIATIPIAINEIAWMGDSADASNEWLELKNNTNHVVDLSQWALTATGDTPFIALSGALAPHEYKIVPRISMRDTGEQFILSYASTTLDSTPEITENHWASGASSTASKKTMERYSSKELGADNTNWGTNLTIIKNGTDDKGAPLNATPGERNSTSYLINKGREITSDLTLTADDGYFLATSTIVSASSTLSIEPGVVIKFLKPNSYYAYPKIRVLGRIEINGTEENPVILEPFVKKGKADWEQGILIIDGASLGTSTIRHARIENLEDVEIFDGAHLEISDSQFMDTYAGVMAFDGSTLSITNTTFSTSTSQAIAVFDGSKLVVASTTIAGVSDDMAIGIFDSTATITNSTVSNVPNDAGIASFNSIVSIASTTVKNIGDDGISFYDGSFGTVVNSTVDSVSGDGVAVYDSSLSISTSTISNTGGDGFAQYYSSTTAQNLIVENGGGDGVAIYYGTAEISDSKISGFSEGSGIHLDHVVEKVKIRDSEISDNAVGVSSYKIPVSQSAELAPDVIVHDNAQDFAIN